MRVLQVPNHESGIEARVVLTDGNDPEVQPPRSPLRRKASPPILPILAEKIRQILWLPGTSFEEVVEQAAETLGIVGSSVHAKYELVAKELKLHARDPSIHLNYPILKDDETRRATRSAYSDQGGPTTRFLAARMSRIWTRLRRSRLSSTSNRGATRCQCHRRRRRRRRQLQSTNRADEWRSRCQAATRSKELGLLPCCHRRRVRWRQRKRQVRQRSGDRRCQRCQYPALQRCRKAARTPPTVSSQRRAQMPRAWELRSRRSLGRLRQQPTPSKQRKGKGKQQPAGRGNWKCPSGAWSRRRRSRSSRRRSSGRPFTPLTPATPMATHEAATHPS